VIHALLDTSVVIAPPEAVSLGPDDTSAISVITIGELTAGVRLARDSGVRALRQARLTAVREAFEPLPVNETTAQHYGEVLAFARSHRRSSKATDLLIIATALATGRTLLTLDDSQAALASAAGAAVARS
jgi:predicted nucleic acid-binding protein